MPCHLASGLALGLAVFHAFVDHQARGHGGDFIGDRRLHRFILGRGLQGSCTDPMRATMVAARSLT